MITPGPYRSTGIQLTDNSISILAPQKQNGWSTVLAQLTVRNYANEEEAIATARLIAAAPDLLEACEQSIKYIEEMNKRIGVEVLWMPEILTRAIKKARGVAV